MIELVAFVSSEWTRFDSEEEEEDADEDERDKGAVVSTEGDKGATVDEEEEEEGVKVDPVSGRL